MKPLVNWYDGEPWFDNPQLVIAGNPGGKKKGRSTMARRARRHSRRRARRNFYSAGALANPRRKRSHRRRRRLFAMNPRRRHRRRSYRRNTYLFNAPRRHHRRRYRRNPEGEAARGMNLFGITIPAWDAIAGTAVGLVTPGMAGGWLIKMIPATWRNPDGTLPSWLLWVVKITSVLGPSLLIRKFASRRFGNYMLLGGVAYMAIDLINTFSPGLIPWCQSLGYQPMLGAYFTRPTTRGQILPYRQQTRSLAPAVADAPDRLDPAGRF